MKPKRPVSETLAVMARAQGQPEAIARRADVVHLPEGRPPIFETPEDREGQRQIADFADLAWLLAAIQAPRGERPAAILMLGLTESERLREFALGELAREFNAWADMIPQRAIRTLLAQAKTYIESFIVRREPIEIPLAGRKRLEWFPPKEAITGNRAPDFVIPITVTANLRAAFLMRLFVLLERHGQLIRTCAEPSCGRLFFKQKRQEYCSKPCSQRVRTAKMRAEPGWQEKRHSYYVKKVATEKGLAVARRVRRRINKEEE